MQLSRQQLYDRVWSEPVTKVAADLGISNVGLQKACKRHRIPTPKRGYWAKKAAGHVLQQEPFQAFNEGDGRSELVTFPGSLDRKPTKAYAGKKGIAAKGPKGSLQRPPFTTIQNVHPLLRRTAQTLRKGEPDNEGVSATGPHECGVAISSSSVERCLSFMDKLVRTLEADGWTLRAEGRITSAHHELGGLEFRIEETWRHVNHIPTEEERAYDREQRLSLGPSLAAIVLRRPTWPSKDRVPSGLLKLQIEGYAAGVRQSWIDAKTQTLEGMLPIIVEGFSSFLVSKRNDEIARREAERKQAAAQRRRELASARHQREGKRLSLLDELAEVAVRVQRIDAWIAQSEPGPEHDNLSRMVGWAKSLRADLQARLQEDGINQLLRDRDLFPDPSSDPLLDPDR